MFYKLLKKMFPGDKIAVLGIVWNLLSFGIIGISGIIMNLIVSYLGADLLGAFNLSLSVYIVMGQIGALGLQNAAVYYLARCDEKTIYKDELFTSFLLLSLCSGMIVSCFTFIFSEFIGIYIFKSSLVVSGLKAISFSLVFFSANKMILGFINGLRKMKTLALMQSIRYVAIIVFMSFCLITKSDRRNIMFCFLFSEILMFIFLVFQITKEVEFKKINLDLMKKGLKFGLKSFAGGIIGELNTKIDIIVLGFFCTDSVVGIYSMASMLTEGFFSLVTVFRSNMNPMFTTLLATNNIVKLKFLMKEIKNKVLVFGVFGVLLVAIVFYFICIIKGEIYFQAMVPLLIILICMLIASPSIVNSNLISQYGKPEIDTLITLFMATINIVLNIILIPFYGIIGAAIATGTSYLVLIVTQKYFIKKLLQELMN